MDFLLMEFSLSEERARSAFYPSTFLQFFSDLPFIRLFRSLVGGNFNSPLCLLEWGDFERC